MKKSHTDGVEFLKEMKSVRTYDSDILKNNSFILQVDFCKKNKLK